MSLFEDVMSLAVQLPLDQRERLAQALGLKLAPRQSLPLLNNAAPDRSKTDPQGWRKAERGHAVLALDESTTIEPGPAALRGLWASLDLEDPQLDSTSATPDTVSALPVGSPVVLHTSVVLALALDLPATQAFWQNPHVEIRLATATYLKLLEMCAQESEKARLQAFVQPYAVLSLGPMASSRAAQIMLEVAPERGLSAVDALTAATAIAHEIPLVTRTAHAFEGIDGLTIATLP